MKRDDYETLLCEALSATHGVSLQLANWREAERARGRFYKIRDHLRRTGNTSFDILSFVVQSDGGLQILRRDQLPRNYDDGLPMEQRPIGRDELPDRFGFCNFGFSVKLPK